MPNKKKTYKLLFINPVNNRRQGLKLDSDSIYPPMALGIIAALTPSNWERLYNLKTLKKKFLNTLKITKNPTTAAWSYSSNIHMRNFCFEGRAEIIDVAEQFPELFNGINKPSN